MLPKAPVTLPGSLDILPAKALPEVHHLRVHDTGRTHHLVLGWCVVGVRVRVGAARVRM